MRARRITAILVILTLLMAMSSVFAQKAAAGKKFVIGYSMPALTHSFWIPMLYGVREQAAKYGMQVIDLNAGGFGNLDTQVSQIENLIQRGVDALLVGATSADGVVPVVQEALREGIPVVGVGSQPNTQITTKILADDYAMGAIQAEAMAKYLNGKGQVAMMSGPPGNHWSDARAKGYRETMQKKYPGISIVADQWTEVSRPVAIELMESWIQAFPDLKGIYCANDDLAAGAVRAIISANLTDKIKVTSCNPTDIGLEYLQQGLILVQAIQQTVLQGRRGVDAIYEKLTGKTPDKEIITPALSLTKENLATFDFSSVKHPDSFKP